MSVTAILALAALFVAAPLCWYVVLKVWRVYRANRNLSVLLQFVGFLAVAVIVTVFALVFVHNDLPEPFLAGDDTKLITRLVLLAGGTLPQALWLWLYR